MITVKKLKCLLYVVFIIFPLVYSCNTNTVYIDRKEDIDTGRVALNRFFNNIKIHNSSLLDSMVSDSLKKLGKNGNLSDLLNRIYSKAGDFKSYVEEDNHTVNTTGHFNNQTYLFKVKVFYDKDTINEIIGFRREKSQIKLFSYHINP